MQLCGLEVRTNTAVKILFNNAFLSPPKTAATLPLSSTHPAQCEATACGHTVLSLLAVPHRVPTPFVCVSLSHCQSFPLSLHLSLFMFSNGNDKMGREQSCLTLWCVCEQPAP